MFGNLKKRRFLYSLAAVLFGLVVIKLGYAAEIARGDAVTVTSVEGGYAGANANDGDAGTRWGSDWGGDPLPDSAWLYIDLGSGQYIDSVYIDWENAAGAIYKIQTANTASSSDAGWSDVANITNGTSGENRHIKFANDIYGRYIRMRGITRTTAYGYSIFEMEVHSGANNAPTDISITNTTAGDGTTAGTVVGVLSATDVNIGDTHSYALAGTCGASDNASFSISGDTLKTGFTADYETKSSYSVCVEVTDAGTATYAEYITITISEGASATPPASSKYGVSRIQRGIVTFSGAAQTVTIKAVDTTKSILEFSVSTASTSPVDYLVGGQITSSTQITFYTYSAVATKKVSWQVIEFAGGVSVQRGSATLGAATTAVNINYVDTTRAFAIGTMTQDGGAISGTDDAMRFNLVSPTSLQCQSTAAIGGGAYAYWQVVQCDSCNVYQIDGTHLTTDANSKDVTIPGGVTVDTMQTMILGSYMVSGSFGMDDISRAVLKDNNEITLIRDGNGVDLTYTLYVVEWTDTTRVARYNKSFTTGAGQDSLRATIASVDTGTTALFCSGNLHRGGSTPDTDDDAGEAWFSFYQRNPTTVEVVRETSVSTAVASFQVVSFHRYSENYSEWQYSKNWTMNTTSSGANVTGDVPNFPVLVRLNSSNFNFAQTLSGGADIRFSKSNGTTHFPYEIERWDNTNSLAELWVKVDSVKGNNSSQYFTMYWGKSGSADSANAPRVWSESAWEAVWHMDTTLDVSGNGMNLTEKTNNTEPMDSTLGCLIGACQDFDGIDDYMTRADHDTLDMGNSFSISGWVKYEAGSAPTKWARIMNKKAAWNAVNGWEISLRLSQDSGFDMNAQGASQFTNYFALNEDTWSNNTWKYITTIFNNTSAFLYVNGLLDSSATIVAVLDAADALYIGRDAAGGTEFNGKMDEMRIYDGLHSANWIKLCYENQRASNTLLSEAIKTWDGGGADSNWSTAANWDPDEAPNSQDVVKFNSTSAKPCSLDVDVTTKEIKFYSSYPGAFKFGSKTLTLTGNADFNGGETITTTTSGYLQFSGSAYQTFIPKQGETFPSVIINKSGSTVLVYNNSLTLADFTLTSGNLDLGDQGLSVSAGSLTDAAAASIDFGTATLTLSGDAEFNQLSSVTAGSGTLVLTAGSGTQNLYCPSGALPTVNHTGNGTLTLNSNTLTCANFSSTGGPVNFNSRDINASGSFTLSGASSKTISNLTGRTFTVGGNALLSGNSTSDRLVLTPGAKWDIDAAGSLTANFVNMDYSDATGSADSGRAFGSTNSGNNIKWAFDTEDLGDWLNSDTLYINTTASGEPLSSNVTNYPVLLRFTSANFTSWANTLTNGADLRFTKLNGVRLKYDIEMWNKTSSTGFVWVRLDTLYANKKTQAIRMYWNKAAVTSTGSGEEVFPTADNWVGVWHMDTTLDETANNNDATKKTAASEPATATSCIIGDCQDFNDDANDYWTIANAASLDMGATASFSGWIRHEDGGTPGWDRIWSRKTGFGDANGWEISFANNNTDLEIRGSGGTAFAPANVSASWSAANWTLVTILFNSTTASVYSNGNFITSGTINTNTDNDLVIGFGDDADQNEANFTGRMDEVRFSTGLLSAAWIKADYQIQKSGSKTFGSVPLVSGLGKADTVSAVQVNPDSVRIQFEVHDPNAGNVTLYAIYKASGGSWTAATEEGYSGSQPATDKNTDRTIYWRADTDVPGVEKTYTVAVYADDPGSLKDTTISRTTVSVDTKPPAGLASFSATTISSQWADLEWTAATDANFNHYEIWYGTSQANVSSRTAGGGAAEWDDADYAAMAVATTDSTRITGLTSGTSYYFKIWAIDNIGNQDTLTSINASTITTVNPAWTKTGLGGINGGAIGTSVLFVGTDNDLLYALNPATGNTKWTYNTSSYGDCRMPTYIYEGGKYKLFFSAGNWVLGQQDDGSSSSQIFAPTNLGYTTGNPYASPDDTSFYVAYTNKITRKKRSDGTNMTGWPITHNGISTTADLVVTNDEVFFAAGDSVCKLDFDGTALACYSGVTTTVPLVSDGTTLYAAATNAGELHAVTSSTMASKWQTATAASNSGAPYAEKFLSSIYVAAGNNVQKVDDGGGSGSVDWTYNAGGNVQSGPILYNNVIYFGRAGGRYYAVYATGASKGTAVTDWPYTTASGDATTGPWIDLTNNYVIFGTENGQLDAFALE